MISATKRIDTAMNKAISEKTFPGAALLVSQKGRVIHRNFYGNASLLPSPEPVTDKTIFDVASLTKPLVTASLALIARAKKGLSLNAQASKYLKELADSGIPDHRKITIRHLLRHASGLSAWKPYFEEIARERPDQIGKRSCRDLYLLKIAAEPLETPVAYRRVYSDLGFILLGILLENFFDRPLDVLFEEAVAKPLGLRNTFFIPVGAPLPRPPENLAATEESVWRKKLLRGEVHDDNAYALGGVAGHAGLFSHVDDLHAFLLAVRQSVQGGHDLFPQEEMLEFVGPKSKIKLCWDTPSPEDSQAGRHFSKNAIGHLGYTGCSFWIDFEKDFHVVLLTNRVHPSSKNESIKQFRPQIHDLIYENLINI